MQASPASAMRRAHEAAIHNDDTVDQNDTCRSIWTPPTPPPSSSPVRDNVLERDVFRQHDLPSQQARTGPLRDANHKRRIVRPLASRRPQPSSPTTMRDLSKTDTRLSLQSAADWHHRLTLQCAQRARAQRQSRIDHQRNGLSNEIVRPDYESREELAIWKRLATREKLAVESEMGEFLKDEYDLMLREIERGETGSPSSTEGPSDMLLEDMDILDPAGEYEEYLKSRLEPHFASYSYPAQEYDVQMSSS